uniref:Putative secreted protein n=1 Tax=Anopheles marajoara TaxID=58244 RepID=A0A2M4CFC8_9DIPT
MASFLISLAWLGSLSGHFCCCSVAQSKSRVQNCRISWRRFFIRHLYSEMRIFLPSMMQVRLGRGRYR